MSNRKLIVGGTQKEGDNLLRHEQSAGNGGLSVDLPPSTINGFSFNKNFIPHTEYIGEGRTGSKEWSDTDLPALEGYDGYTVTKTGYIITKTAGTDFDLNLLNHFFVLGGKHYEILSIIDADNIGVKYSSDATTSSGYIRAPVYADYSHKLQKKVIKQVGLKVYYSDIEISDYTEILNISGITLVAVISTIYAFDNEAILSNPAGLFRIILDVEHPYFYRMNSLVPDVLITGVAQTPELTYGRRYWYGNSILRADSYHKNRLDTGVYIEQETGPNQMNAERIDYGEVFTELAVGAGTETYGVLRCGTDSGLGAGSIPFNTAFQAWAALDNATFAININGEGPIAIEIDFTGVASMDEVRAKIEAAIRSYWITATVKIRNAGALPYWEITSGKFDTYTVSYLTAAGYGTDISIVDAASGCGMNGNNFAAPNTDDPLTGLELDNNSIFTTPSVIGTLTSYDQQFTHYPIYCSKDTGPEGTDPITGLGNNPDHIGFLDEVPKGKAFTATRVAATGIVTATAGQFSIKDVGSYLQWEGGGLHQITEYTGPNTVVTAIIGGAEAGSCGLGTGNVFTVSQNGYAITIISGYAFVATDVGKPIFYSNGYIARIRTVDSANTATANEYIGATGNIAAIINPTQRHYNDTTLDMVITARMKALPMSHRYFTNLPIGAHIAAILPGFIVVAEEDQNVIYYSQTGDKYRAGYYRPDLQVDMKPEDEIKSLQVFENRLDVICKNNTYYTDSSQAKKYVVQDYGEQYSILPGLSFLAAIGLLHKKGIARKDNVCFILTSEPALRILDGYQYSEENYADGRVMTFLRKYAERVILTYNRISGLIIWGSEKA